MVIDMKISSKWFFPVLFVLWALVIFFFSSQTYDEQRLTFLDRFNTPFWYRMFDGISFTYGGSGISVQLLGVGGFLEFFIRKAAHLTVYFVLGFLTIGLWNSFLKNRFLNVIVSIFCVAVYAGTDEYHQSFTGGRTPMWQDVVIDSFGGVLGILCFLFFFVYRRPKSV